MTHSTCFLGAAAFYGMCLQVPSVVLAWVGTDMLPEDHSRTQWYADYLGWPEGTIDLVNHELRSAGWHFWFSECANDVYSYGFRCRNTEDANQLIALLAKVKAQNLSVILSPHADEGIPPGNDPPRFAVTFSIGSQKIIDQWYQRLPVEDGPAKRRIFGVHRYEKPPAGLGPTLTLHLGNDSISLQKLRLPPNISVASGASEHYRKTHPNAALVKEIDQYVADRLKERPTTQPATRPAASGPHMDGTSRLSKLKEMDALCASGFTATGTCVSYEPKSHPYG